MTDFREVTPTPKAENRPANIREAWSRVRSVFAIRPSQNPFESAVRRLAVNACIAGDQLQGEKGIYFKKLVLSEAYAEFGHGKSANLPALTTLEKEHPRSQEVLHAFGTIADFISEKDPIAKADIKAYLEKYLKGLRDAKKTATVTAIESGVPLLDSLFRLEYGFPGNPLTLSEILTANQI